MFKKNAVKKNTVLIWLDTEDHIDCRTIVDIVKDADNICTHTLDDDNYVIRFETKKVVSKIARKLGNTYGFKTITTGPVIVVQ